MKPKAIRSILALVLLVGLLLAVAPVRVRRYDHRLRRNSGPTAAEHAEPTLPGATDF